MVPQQGADKLDEVVKRKELQHNGTRIAAASTGDINCFMESFICLDGGWIL